DPDIDTWTRYESLVNLAFLSAPATIMCTYDERAFPARVLANALTTHPGVACGRETTASATYRVPEDLLLDVFHSR
ncbi:MAG: hypothetical protein QOJ74_2328, partial [Ilumatobacteraceae bacterium]|nr:hypothetical protein [Ilumatobacteraceae bacterium]